MTSKSIVAQSGLLWSVCILVLQRCDRRWRFTSCFTYQTTSWTLAHLQTTTLKGINVYVMLYYLNLHVCLCVYITLYIYIHCVIPAGVNPWIQLYVALMCMVIDSPLAGTLGGLFQQCQCCISWPAALLVIHKGELLYYLVLHVYI